MNRTHKMWSEKPAEKQELFSVGSHIEQLLVILWCYLRRGGTNLLLVLVLD